MEIDTQTSRTLKAVFDRFTSGEEEYGFTRSRVPVTLARYGDENLVSRSQAKRLLARFDRFREVILDFEGVQSIGQAFADEIFRVFATEHPKVLLRWTGSVPDVEAMIKRARAAGHVMDSNQLALFGSSLRSSPKTTARMHLTDYQSEGDQSKGS